MQSSSDELGTKAGKIFDIISWDFKVKTRPACLFGRQFPEFWNMQIKKKKIISNIDFLG